MWLNKNMDERAVNIFYMLKRKFVLLLDDVWKRLDILKLGVPLPDGNNVSKVVFTTRSEEVCGHMEAHRSIKMECLVTEKALELFEKKVGEGTLNSHPSIPHFAEQVAAKCKGLPLVLTTTGRAMANKKDPTQWKRVVEILKSYPSKVSGMVDEVFLILEFSYDCLPSATHKICFLYCSLFPEDHDIKKDELVELWIGEGFLDEFDNIYEARSEGEDIINCLKVACLLESNKTEDSVKMHDVIRDMALWVACEHGEKPKFVVNDGSTEAYNVNLAKWKEAERMSLWGSKSGDLPDEHFSPSLLTMLIRETKLETFPIGFFTSAQAIKVLDLSHNSALVELPAEIGELVNLHYLNLSYTGIRGLPIELKKLRSLRCFLLNNSLLLYFPTTVISSLLSLQMFSKLMTGNEYSVYLRYDERILLQELACLGHLNDISIVLYSASSVQVLLNSPQLQKGIKFLRVVCHFNSFDSLLLNMLFLSLRSMERLEILEISNFKSSESDQEDNRVQGMLHEYIPDNSKLTGHDNICNLRILLLIQCDMLDLTWLTHAPNLQSLKIVGCGLLEELIGEKFGAEQSQEVKWDVFGSLENLELRILP
ncbi:Disease resistance protein [Quillaja saponaria]|uniref:Disease resistance protein n=1 Tax=Quillaja saponaria TaxID=32244 RepID=A0AAD7PPN7_QUISA|nr:Disease resistance protein [Quillaja saponaria]